MSKEISVISYEFQQLMLADIHSLIKYVDIVNAELIESTLKQTIMCSCFNDFVWLSKYKKMLHASNIY
jgi:hypothetical protein